MTLETIIYSGIRHTFSPECFVGDQIIIKEIPDALKPPKIGTAGQPDLPKKFDPSKAAQVKSNFEIDRQIKLKNPPDSLIIINSEFHNFNFVGSPNAIIKPIAAFMVYLNSLTVPGTISKTLSYKKGFTSHFEATAEVKASVSVSIEVTCDLTQEVTTGFEYDERMKTEQTVTTTETLTEGEYCVYQNALLYAIKFYLPIEITLPGPFFMNKLGLTLYPPKDKIGKPTYTLYTLATCYRNDPFTIRYSDELYSPISYEEVCDYIMGDGRDSWDRS
ncbi:hypothetical protein CYY_003465 [Polysphondylium violaceum]|uniref:Monalysin Pore-forming domain-containing protein n=1 Tax=Polysphondylium violaceum TaxID=133409 RepID=A0A8J4PWU1_9MYCE|nr:hypothetical protein CYY_003465 [Polysphondylium violaceum]